jgi:NitT/TauT family transport system permease protein
MTAQLIHEATETPDEAAGSSESSARTILGATLTFLALVALWELVVRGFDIPGWLLPAPSAIAIALAESWDELMRQSRGTHDETWSGLVR